VGREPIKLTDVIPVALQTEDEAERALSGRTSSHDIFVQNNITHLLRIRRERVYSNHQQRRTQMTTDQRISEAFRIAKQGDLAAARNIIQLAEGLIPSDRMERAWAKFGKIWRGE
jgi:hypothetical protein